MKKQNFVNCVWENIVIRNWTNFAKNGIIEIILPTFASKNTEFECLLLNCVMTMIVISKEYPERFESEDIYTNFMVACSVYYEKERLFIPELGYFDENKTYELIEDKFDKYKNALERLAETNDIVDIAEMVFSPQFGLPSVIKEMSSNRNKLEISMMQSLNIINTELPLL